MTSDGITSMRTQHQATNMLHQDSGNNYASITYTTSYSTEARTDQETKGVHRASLNYILSI